MLISHWFHKDFLACRDSLGGFRDNLEGFRDGFEGLRDNLEGYGDSLEGLRDPEMLIFHWFYKVF